MNILNDVLAEFAQIANIPRPSGHEQKISDYLYHCFLAIGCQVIQDEKLNIIADKPASPGCEQAPMTILQGHMDMVCIAHRGVVYEPCLDAIHLKQDAKYLMAEGTSLGADDGIGLAEILYIFKHAEVHGPLRAICTVDEEGAMTGAVHLASQHLEDAAFLINCDSEDFSELTIGSAGFGNIDFYRKVNWKKPLLHKAWKISVQGLLGGHSGEKIGSGRGNAIHILAILLWKLKERHIPFEISYLNAGKARNAIPETAEAIILMDIAKDEFLHILNTEKEFASQIYGTADPNLNFQLTEAELPPAVFSSADADKALQLLTALHTGVFALAQEIPGTIETSANLGTLRTDGTGISLQYLPRSSVDLKIIEFGMMARALAEMTGFQVHVGTPSPGWREHKKSMLVKIMTEVFLKQQGTPLKVSSIHAALECGWHACKQSKLDMVSTGATTLNIHTPEERLLLADIVPHMEFLLETLRRIAKL